MRRIYEKFTLSSMCEWFVAIHNNIINRNVSRCAVS